MEFVSYFAFLFAGLSFFSLPTEHESFVGVLIVYLLVFLVVFCLAKLLAFLKKRAGTEEEHVSFHLLATCLYGPAFCFFAREFAYSLPSVSKEYAGGRFSHLFIILSIFLALYIGKRGIRSYRAFSVMALPVIVIPSLITYFNFIELGGMKELMRGYFSHISLDLSLVPKAFFLCAGVGSFVLISRGSAGKGFFFAFLIFGIFFAFEGAKYLLWFGEENLSLIKRPDRVMLAQVPFINVQELFVFSYYTAFVLKISLFATAARIFFAKAFKKAHRVLPYFWCFILFYGSYLFVPKGMEWKLSFFSFSALYICFVAVCLAKIAKGCKKGEKSGKKEEL